ncbi:hypothetical protein CcaCcLH18_06809 [Colletotrichum camelliae]|nr:hypothetical protein CcaCcLH18_06809 [Colletotrichum camelliae]
MEAYIKKEASDAHLPTNQGFITISHGSRTRVIPKPSTYAELDKTMRNHFYIPDDKRIRIHFTPHWMDKEVELDLNCFCLVTSLEHLRVNVAQTVLVRVKDIGMEHIYLIDSWCPLGKVLEKFRPRNIALLYNGAPVEEFDTPETLNATGGSMAMELLFVPMWPTIKCD